MRTEVSLAAMLAMASAVHGHVVPIVRSSLTPPGSTPLFNGAPAGPAIVGKNNKAQFQILVRYRYAMPSNAIMFKKLTSAGSDKVWIPGSTTPSAHSYNWSGKPLNRTQDMGYGGGLEVKGPFYEDDISIGGITAHDFQFFVNSEGKGGFGDYGAEGIFGLCYCPSTDKQNSSSFFETLVIQKKVKEPAFGVFIGRDGEAGELVLGGYDSKRFLGPVTTVEVVEQGPWGIRVDGAYVNGKLVPSSRGICKLTCILLQMV